MRLFERTTRQPHLTDEGRLYLEHCRLALQSLDDAHAALQSGCNIVRGKLRISATSDFGRNRLAGWLDDFNLQYPDASLALMFSDGLSNMLQDEIDVALRFGVLPDSGLVARRLADKRRVLCAAPGYLSRHGQPSEPRDLARFHCIVHGAVPGEIHQWLYTHGDEVQGYSVPPESARETNDGALARDWALRGHGLIVKSVWDIVADLQAGRLAIVPPEWRCPDAPLHAPYHRSRYLTPRLRVLLDFLVERCRQEAALIDSASAVRPQWTPHNR